ncbi:YegP family protein [Tenacibaculum ovolyticum]|uniref:YegP family protein n=1 Tax=Tenacibaculum ovolyticum TaxID=104270 RepID=UPI00040D0AFA|nr:YegP family protein [Tenacibaculum ovolyticum]WBX78023.1 YegP family protein [Tenacibaculum ovolyticum]
MGKSKFEIKKRKDEDFMFNLKAGNGEVILTSQGYESKQGCETGIASVKVNAPFDNRYDKKQAVNSDYYFNLKASNGQVIGTSEMYVSTDGRDKGIASVKTNAPDAEIIDLT